MSSTFTYCTPCWVKVKRGDTCVCLLQASLQLIEATNISPVIGRLRRNASAAVAHRAEQLATRWHAMASATLSHVQNMGR